MFYFGNDYTARARGGAWRAVACESCHQRYHYHMERGAKGTAHSPFMLNNSGAARAAEQRAAARVERRLATECDPVPCPFCGWYQRGMYPEYAKHLYGWMGHASVALFILSLVLFIASFAMIAGKDTDPDPAVRERNAIMVFVPAVACLVGAVGMRVGRWLRRSLANPNDLVPEDARRRLGRELALTDDQFEQMLAANGRGGG